MTFNRKILKYAMSETYKTDAAFMFIRRTSY